MTGRGELQSCYELAFHPPRLNVVWSQVKAGTVENTEELGEMLDTALLLHQALPSGCYVSRRALNRLALHQAKARAFGTVQFPRDLRRHLGRPRLAQTEIPGSLVRAIGLPEPSRRWLAVTGSGKPAP